MQFKAMFVVLAVFIIRASIADAGMSVILLFKTNLLKKYLNCFEYVFKNKVNYINRLATGNYINMLLNY